MAGLVGREPPFHTPVFVLTHHVRPSFTLSDTTFHFVDATPHEALEQAKAAANGQDVRIGGGVTTIRAFLEAERGRAPLLLAALVTSRPPAVSTAAPRARPRRGRPVPTEHPRLPDVAEDAD